MCIVAHPEILSDWIHGGSGLLQLVKRQEKSGIEQRYGIEQM